MNSRIYLDYNATSPLSQKVIDFLGKGDLPFANPASIHTTGKSVRSLIEKNKTTILETFGAQNFNIVFTSGATEGINTVFNSLGKDDALLYASTDHPAVLESACMAMARDVYVESFNPDRNGDFNVDKICDQISQLKNKRKNVLMNFTWVHNETGVIWPLALAAEIKKRTGCLVHIDAVQAVGKIPNWKELNLELDCYTFSAHKFGALKGLGFSLVNPNFNWTPLIVGGGQQFGHRSGTENLLGVKTIALALEDIQSVNIDEIRKLKNEIEKSFKQVIGDDGEIVGYGSQFDRSVNTSLLLFKKHKADFVLTNFDLQGLDVSMGSACSSDSLKESHVLKGMGIEFTENAIRLSLGYANLQHSKEIIAKCSDVFSRLS